MEAKILLKDLDFKKIKTDMKELNFCTSLGYESVLLDHALEVDKELNLYYYADNDCLFLCVDRAEIKLSHIKTFKQLQLMFNLLTDYNIWLE